MSEIKIGIGLLTYQRPECKQLFLDQLKKHPPYFDFKLHIEEGNTNIANGKNNNLHALSDCNYIFLFDDDAFPIKDDWDLPFIASGHHHLSYMNNSYRPISNDGEVTKYQDCSGCFLFLTNEVFKKVGYFNPAYVVNGMEHIGYSTRIKKATREDGFFCLNETKDYIYSLDLQNDIDWKVWHKTNITAEQKTLAMNGNREILMNEVNGEKLYYGKA